MKLWSRRNVKIEGRDLESWLKPEDEVVRRIARRIEQTPERHRSYRLALTAAVTVVGLTAFGVFGGISYAAKAVAQAVHITEASKAPTHVAAPSSALRTATPQKDKPPKPPKPPKGTNGNGNGNDNDNDDQNNSSPSSSSSSDQYGGKTTICHKTGSKKNPYVLITVSNNALPAHKAHGDTLPGPGGTCPGPSIP
jgi:hypothetical protein